MAERKNCLPQGLVQLNERIKAARLQRLDWIEIDLEPCLPGGPRIQKVAVYKKGVVGQDDQGRVFRPLQILPPAELPTLIESVKDKQLVEQTFTITPTELAATAYISGGKSYETVENSKGKLVLCQKFCQSWQAIGLQLKLI